MLIFMENNINSRTLNRNDNQCIEVNCKHTVYQFQNIWQRKIDVNNMNTNKTTMILNQL